MQIQPYIQNHKLRFTYQLKFTTYMYLLICFFFLTILERNITNRNTVVRIRNLARVFFLHVSKQQDRHFIVSQNAPTSESCFQVSSIVHSLSFFFPPFCFARHVRDNCVGLIAKNTRERGQALSSERCSYQLSNKPR